MLENSTEPRHAGHDRQALGMSSLGLKREPLGMSSLGLKREPLGMSSLGVQLGMASMTVLGQKTRIHVRSPRSFRVFGEQ